MEKIEDQRLDSPVLEGILSNLSLRDRFSLKQSYSKFDHPFSITDTDGLVRTFGSLTLKNIQAYERIQRLKFLDAAKYGDYDMITELLQDPDLNVNSQDSRGYTALMFASEKGWVDIVKELLLNPNMDLNIVNSTGNTALILAALDNQTEVIRELLKSPDLDINIRNLEGLTALQVAEANQNGAILQLLQPEI